MKRAILLLGQPEAHILVAHWVLGVGHKLVDLTVLELRAKANVLRPEQANVGNIEEYHG